jgi:hypothetical protein
MFVLQCQVVFEDICFGPVLSIACQYTQVMTPKITRGLTKVIVSDVQASE